MKTGLTAKWYLLYQFAYFIISNAQDASVENRLMEYKLVF
jgi:hypothetical protein